MAIDEFGLGPVWDDEEEKKRKRLAALGLNSGLKPIPASPKSSPLMNTPNRVSRAPSGQDRYIPMEERDRSFFKKESDRATTTILQNQKAHKAPMTEYLTLAQKLGGQDKLAIRLAAISSLWNVYAHDFDGRNTVWQLLKSPYDIDTIEGMLRKGGGSLYAAPTKAHEAVVPASFARKTGVKQGDWLGAAWATQYASLEKIQGKQSLSSFLDELTTPPEVSHAHQVPRKLKPGETEEDLLSGYFGGAEATKREVTDKEANLYKYALEATVMGLPIGKLIKPAVGAGKLVRYGAGATKTMIRHMQTAPAVITGATEYFGFRAQQRQAKVDEAFRQGTEVPREAAMNPLLPTSVDYIMKQTNPMYKTLDDMKSLVLNLEEPDAKAVQDWMVDNGYAGDLVAEGKWTWPWIDKVIDIAEEEQRNVIDKQRIYMEMGAVPIWAKIGAPMSDPVWQQGEALVEASRSAQAELERDHMYLSYGANSGNVPQSPADWTMWMNRMDAEGLPQAFLKAPLQGALHVGGAVQGGLSAFNLYSRMRNNDRYQTAMQILMADVDAKPFQYVEGSPFPSKPSEPNAAFAMYQATNGNYKDDPQTQALLAAVETEVGRMLSKPGNPDYILTVAHLFGVPYDGVEKFGADNPNFIHGSNLFFDIATAVANPLGKTFKALRPRIAAKEFASSGRAMRSVSRIARVLAEGNVGRATSLVKGSQAGELIRAVYHVKGKKKLLDADSAVVVDIAKEIKRNIEMDNAHGVARALNDNVKFADDVTKTVARARVNWRKSTRPAFKTEGGARTVALTEDEAALNAIKTKLVTRQNKFHDVFSKENIEPTLMRLASEAYAGKDVFPYFRTKGQKVMSLREKTSAAFNDHIAQIEHTPTRVFLTEMFGNKLRYAAISEKEFGAWNALDRAEDAALLVSGDAKWANDFYARLSMAKSDASVQRIAAELLAKYNERFISRTRGTNIQDWADRWSAGAERIIGREGRLTDEYGPEGALTVRPELDIAAGGGRVLGAYKAGDELKQVVASEAQQAYKMKLFRQALFSPYRTPAEAGAFVRRMYQARNAWRGANWLAHTLSQPLRRYTVAMGGLLLFQKHALTDTFRAEMEAPGTMALKVSGRMRKTYEGNLSKLSPAMRDRILAEEVATYYSEMQFNSGSAGVKWIAQPIRGKDGRLVNAAESAHSLRRIVQSEPYRVWAKDGESGLRKYFDTIEGKRFLSRNGHYSKARTFYDDLGEKLKGKDMHSRSVEEFIDEFTLKQWVPLEAQLENVMPRLKSMSLNNEFLDLKAIEKLLEDNPFDNAVLNTKYEFMGNSGFAGNLVGKAMYMNKLNRKALYRRTFNTQFSQLVKEGMDADGAARVASTLGSMTVNKVMFDLANAMTTEAKHRWFAWFATKHRLYATYMGKLAIERPTLGAAAIEIQSWMEQRNEDKNVSEFDKYDLIFNIPSWVPLVGGQQMSMNLAPYMWFADFPLESSLGQAVERTGVAVVNMAAGREVMHPSPNPFGYSTGRWDAAFLAFRDMISSPIADQMRKGDARANEMTDEQVSEWVGNRAPDESARWNRLMHMQMALALANGEGEISEAAAFERAMWGNLKYESFKMVRPYSAKIVGQEEVEVQKGLRTFFDLAQDDSEAAYEFLRTRPDVQKMLNASMDPREKAQLDDFRYKLSQINDNTALEVEQSFSMGTLAEDAKDIMGRHQDAVDRMTQPQYDEYNQVGTEWYRGAEPEAFRNALMLMVPLVPVDDLMRQGHVRTEQEVTDYENTELKPAFEEELYKAGLAPGDTSQPLYKMLKLDMVNDPLAKFLGRNPGDYSTWYEESAARYLARGGKDGVFKQDKFLSMVRDRHSRELMGRGIRDGMGAKSDPFLAYMSTADKEAIGWNSNPAAKEGWYQWAYDHWAIRKYTRENNISATSKAGKKIWGDFEQSASQLAKKNPGFGTEWEFSRYSLDERMEFLGVGSGNDEVSKGWREFLAMSRNHRDALAEVVVPSTKQIGVGPRAQSAGPVTQDYVAQIALLAKSNTRWWEEFRGKFTLSKFGFYWRTPDASDDFLWWGEKDIPTSNDLTSFTPWEVWEE